MNKNHLQAQTFSKSSYIKFGSYIQTGLIKFSSQEREKSLNNYFKAYLPNIIRHVFLESAL